ncbi:uncharacterized protein CDV56_108730 [Aspergillus thermomutatus]|uniref:Uncharacterized protein n=1 Tax=Aspergillus thermomutatus TaxID=41047 RepID=A0A397HAK7_ASPTH|nr:uncharacterized protein CDV56_108730 [Aspergillus thermomutatus]RHZ60131.1 hypothetical protein CDV56_108730 [Aspergillus thermomutatus]
MTRRDLSKEAMKAKRSAIINHIQQLQQALSSVSTPNFGIDELCELGLKPIRVELTPDKELLEFEPCFFMPQPKSISEYPFMPGEVISDLEEERTYEKTLAELIRMYPSSHAYNRRSGIYISDRPASLVELSPLRDLLTLWTAKGRVSIDPGDRIGDGHWNAWYSYMHIDQPAPMPHIIVELHVQYRGNDTSLTHAEVSGLLHHMYHWYDFEEFEQYAMGPVSLHLFSTDPELF